MARLYISQTQLDRSSRDGRVHIEGETMHMPALGRTFRLQAAVHIVRTIEGVDVQSLQGKVKTPEQLRALGAELSGTSLLCGEAAYECTEGFIGIPTDTGRTIPIGKVEP